MRISTKYLVALVGLVVCAVGGACRADAAADLRQARAAYGVAKFDEAYKIATGIVTTDATTAPEALRMVWDCIDQQRRYSMALEFYTKLLGKDSGCKAPEKDVKRWIVDCNLMLKNWDAATSMLQTLLKDAPEDASKWHYMLGKCYQNQSKLPEAMAEFKTAVEVYDSSKNDPRDLKDARMRLMACYLDAGKWNEALDLLAKLLVDYPFESTNLVSGKIGPWNSHYSDAVAGLRKVIADTSQGNPGLRFLRKGLVNASMASRNWDDAVSQASTMLADYPGDAWELHRAMGKCYQEQRKFPEAVEAYKKALAESPKDNPEMKWMKILFMQSCMGAADWKSAYTVAEELRRDLPNDIGIWGYPLIHACLDAMEYEKAIPVCKEIVACKPDMVVDALTVLAECMYPLGKGDEAFAFQEEYFKQHADRKLDADWVRCRTKFFAEKDFAKAATLLEKFIADYPNSPSTTEAKRFLIDSWECTSDIRGAEVLKEILKNAPSKDKAGLTIRIANIYFKGKKYREAAQAYKDALKIEDTEPEYRAEVTYQLAICYMKSELLDSARRYMLRVTEQYPNTEWAKEARGALYVWSTK